MTVDVAWIITIFLVAIRLGSLFLLTPLTPIRQLPVHVRLLFVLMLSAVMISNLDISLPFNNTSSVILAGAAELMNGLILSLSVFAAFAVFHLAGALIDSQMGLNSTLILNPQTHTHDPIMGHFLNLLVVLIFFASGCHRWFFKGLMVSIKQIPPGSLIISKGLKPALLQFSQLFVLGLVIASPVVFSLLLLDIASGIITRNMPQISIYFITLPIKILLGFLLLAMSLMFFQPIIERIFNRVFFEWQGLMS